jgi:4-amino-4-deoxy-L-arabinose transferase-like glycosyltransferase
MNEQSEFQSLPSNKVKGLKSITDLKGLKSITDLKGLKSKIDWLVLPLLIFIPRLLNLDVFLTPDEPLMLQHARDFMTGLTGGDFSQTLGIGWPGVTVAGWAAPVVGLASTELGAYLAGRVVTVIVTGSLLLVMYRLARSLLGRWPALIGIGLLALDPYSLAYGRLLHIATSLSLFMTLAGLGCLLWLRDTHRRWLLLTGLFTGLALLTKSTALLLGPMLSVIVISWGIGTGRWRDQNWWLAKIGGLVVAAVVAVVVFFGLWPAMWTAPTQAVGHTFRRLLIDQEAGAHNLGLFWFGRFVEDPGLAFYPVAFLLKSTPWLLAGLLLSLAYCVYRLLLVSRNVPHLVVAKHQLPVPALNQIEGTNYQLPITITLWFFALTYLVIMTIASKKSVRYMMPAFPAFYLLAGLAFYQTAKMLPNRRVFSLRPISLAPAASLLAILLALITFTGFYHPYYFTYYNPLLLGWRWAPQTLLVGWGEGLDGAARYLNKQPELSVSAWYEGLFPILYKGEVQPVVPQENLVTADQTVLYINQVQRDIPSPNIIHYFRTRRRPEHTVRLAGIDYAWVYPGPVAGFRPDPSPLYPIGGQFGSEVQLLGYDLHPHPTSGGDSLIVTLYWRVLAPPSSDRFVFLRLVDAQGHIWARTDGPPVMGLWPVEHWQPEMLIEDAQELPIPPGTPPGQYRLEVGMYDSTTPVPRNLNPIGQPTGQGGGLLLGQVEVEWQSVQAEADMPGYADIQLAANARLVGYAAPFVAATAGLPVATTGDIITVELAWQEASTLFLQLLKPPNDLVMFEWRQNGRPVAEQLEPLPLPMAQWGRRALLRSQHDLIVPPALAAGRYDLVVMLHNGSDPAGDVFGLGSLEVTAPTHQFAPPAEAIAPAIITQLAARSNQKITLAAYELFPSSQGGDFVLYWQTDAPLTTSYKVFAQLLNADNEVVVQSDMIPGGGVRPTTGWLPNEIIADTHTLYFGEAVPPGSYRLITGFYNSVNGKRLPVFNEAGEVVGDAITVAEVIVP